MLQLREGCMNAFNLFSPATPNLCILLLVLSRVDYSALYPFWEK